mgnify:CR=1 FL=1
MKKRKEIKKKKKKERKERKKRKKKLTLILEGLGAHSSEEELHRQSLYESLKIEQMV